MFLIMLVHSFHPVGDPADADLQKRNAQLRQSGQDTAANQREHRRHYRKGHRQRVTEEESIVAVSSNGWIGAGNGMDGHGHIELLCFSPCF